MTEDKPEQSPSVLDWSKYPDEGLIADIQNALADAQAGLQRETGQSHGTILKDNMKVIIPDQEPFEFIPKKTEEKAGKQIAITLGEVTIIQRKTRNGKIDLYFMIEDQIKTKRGSQIKVHRYDGKENDFKIITQPDLPGIKEMREELHQLYWNAYTPATYMRMNELEEALGSRALSFKFICLKPGENLKPQWWKIADAEELGIIPERIEGNLLYCTATRPFTVLTGTKTPIK